MANQWDNFHENMGDETAALHMSGAFDSEVGHDHDSTLPGRGAPIKSTVDQTLAGGANTGTLTQILSWIVRQIKLIINKPNWYDEVDLFSNFESQINLNNPLGVAKPYFGTVLPESYLWCDGKTIGDALSGATARANEDVHDLFVVLWSATGLKIYESTGALSARGASAEADWAAHKRLELPKINGRNLIGCDNLGGTSADVVKDDNADIVGGVGGEETHILTINEMPNHSHGIYSGYYGGSDNSIATDAQSRGSHIVYHNTLAVGGGQAHNNMPPYMACNFIMRY